MDSSKWTSIYHGQDQILAIVREGYKKFEDIVHFFTAEENQKVIKKLRDSNKKFKAVYIPDGNVEQTPDHLVFAKTIIFQNFVQTYHREDTIYTYVQCKWCRVIDRVRFVRPNNPAEIRNFYTLYCPLLQNKCSSHWASYNEAIPVNRSSSPIVISDSDSDSSDSDDEFAAEVKSPSSPPPRRRRRRSPRKQFQPKPYWRPAAAADKPVCRVSPQPYEKEEESPAQEVPPVYEYLSTDDEVFAEEEEESQSILLD
jgi:hypothetical protein